ncbi:MAG: hypothetical protein ACLSCW_07295 [Gemmiger formicilis]
MMTLPDIPRLYTALAEVLAVLVYAQAAPPRAAKPVTYAATAGWAAVLGVFLQLTGSVPLAWWLPCMVAAIAWLYLYLWGTREMNLLEAGYSCARAFILAELAASVEWQLHCVLWPQQRATAPLSVLLLAAVYTAVYGFLYWLERRHAALHAADHYRGGDADGCRHGGHGVCGQQSELYLRQRCHDERDEHFLHPHAGGYGGRADPDGSARAAARGRTARRADGHGQCPAPPV